MKQSETLPTVVANRIEAAIEALRDGRGILLVDDDDRENEGDIILPYF